MSQNPTARFSPSNTCFELYQNFQIQLHDLRRQLAELSKEEKTQEVSQFILGKLDVFTDIVETMFNKVTFYMNDTAQEKEIYQLKSQLEQKVQKQKNLEEVEKELRTLITQQQSYYQIKKNKLKRDVDLLQSELCETKRQMNDQRQEMAQTITEQRRMQRQIESWFIRRLEKVQLLVIQKNTQDNQLENIVAQIRKFRQKLPWKINQNTLIGGLDCQNDNGSRNDLENMQFDKIQPLKFNTQNFIEGEEVVDQFDKIEQGRQSPHKNREKLTKFQNQCVLRAGGYVSDGTTTPFSNYSCYSSFQAPSEIDQTMNQGFIFSVNESRGADDINSSSNNINGNDTSLRKSGNNRIFSNSNYLFTKNEQQMGEQKNNSAIREMLVKLDNNNLSISKQEKIIYNLFLYTDNLNGQRSVNKDVQLEDLLNFTDQNNSISLQFNQENIIPPGFYKKQQFNIGNNNHFNNNNINNSNFSQIGINQINDNNNMNFNITGISQIQTSNKILTQNLNIGNILRTTQNNSKLKTGKELEEANQIENTFDNCILNDLSSFSKKFNNTSQNENQSDFLQELSPIKDGSCMNTIMNQSFNLGNHFNNIEDEFQNTSNKQPFSRPFPLNSRDQSSNNLSYLNDIGQVIPESKDASQLFNLNDHSFQIDNLQQTFNLSELQYEGEENQNSKIANNPNVDLINAQNGKFNKNAPNQIQNNLLSINTNHNQKSLTNDSLKNLLINLNNNHQQQDKVSTNMLDQFEQSYDKEKALEKDSAATKEMGNISVISNIEKTRQSFSQIIPKLDLSVISNGGGNSYMLNQNAPPLNIGNFSIITDNEYNCAFVNNSSQMSDGLNQHGNEFDEGLNQEENDHNLINKNEQSSLILKDFLNQNCETQKDSIQKQNNNFDNILEELKNQDAFKQIEKSYDVQNNSPLKAYEDSETKRNFTIFGEKNSLLINDLQTCEKSNEVSQKFIEINPSSFEQKQGTDQIITENHSTNNFFDFQKAPANQKQSCNLMNFQQKQQIKFQGQRLQKGNSQQNTQADSTEHSFKNINIASIPAAISTQNMPPSTLTPKNTNNSNMLINQFNAQLRDQIFVQPTQRIRSNSHQSFDASNSVWHANFQRPSGPSNNQNSQLFLGNYQEINAPKGNSVHFKTNLSSNDAALNRYLSARDTQYGDSYFFKTNDSNKQSGENIKISRKISERELEQQSYQSYLNEQISQINMNDNSNNNNNNNSRMHQQEGIPIKYVSDNHQLVNGISYEAVHHHPNPLSNLISGSSGFFYPRNNGNIGLNEPNKSSILAQNNFSLNNEENSSQVLTRNNPQTSFYDKQLQQSYLDSEKIMMTPALDQILKNRRANLQNDKRLPLRATKMINGAEVSVEISNNNINPNHIGHGVHSQNLSNYGYNHINNTSANQSMQNSYSQNIGGDLKEKQRSKENLMLNLLIKNRFSQELETPFFHNLNSQNQPNTQVTNSNTVENAAAKYRSQNHQTNISLEAASNQIQNKNINLKRNPGIEGVIKKQIEINKQQNVLTSQSKEKTDEDQTQRKKCKSYFEINENFFNNQIINIAQNFCSPTNYANGINNHYLDKQRIFQSGENLKNQNSKEQAKSASQTQLGNNIQAGCSSIYNAANEGQFSYRNQDALIINRFEEDCSNEQNLNKKQNSSNQTLKTNEFQILNIKEKEDTHGNFQPHNKINQLKSQKDNSRDLSSEVIKQKGKKQKSTQINHSTTNDSLIKQQASRINNNNQLQPSITTSSSQSIKKRKQISLPQKNETGLEMDYKNNQFKEMIQKTKQSFFK